MPSLLSITVEIDPRVVERTTLAPLCATLLPFESFNCTVMVELVVPSAIIEDGDAVTVVLVGSADSSSPK